MLGTYIPGWSSPYIAKVFAFSRSLDFSGYNDRRFQATGHKAQKIRVTGYLMWGDDHNGSADAGSSLSAPMDHHPWRSTAWEIHPIIKIEVIE